MEDKFMVERKVKQQICGYRTVDGAGVNLVRVLGNATAYDFDPILMLDSFDSVDPKDYIAGFPMHPHRGIETISYVYQGEMTHKDSLGNEDTIGNGEIQWMTAGSGIFHEEKLPATSRLLGIQLWLNLSTKDKMVEPEYHRIKTDEIEEIQIENGKLRLLAGNYGDHKGYQSKYLPLDYYDIHLGENSKFQVETEFSRSVMVFLLQGEAYIGEELIKEKVAAKLTEGELLNIRTAGKRAQILLMSSLAIQEPIVWGGPIVMSTKEELNQAFEELRTGNFIKTNINY
jgi:quercetin 2,3-dioxygenase